MRGVLFDVDGTLVDTTYLHAVCWWDAFRANELYVPMANIHHGIGMGSDELLDHLLGEDRDRDLDETVIGAHLALYQQYWQRLRPLPGASELLRRCKSAGLQVVLASSASKEEFAALAVRVAGVWMRPGCNFSGIPLNRDDHSLRMANGRFYDMAFGLGARPLCTGRLNSGIIFRGTSSHFQTISRLEMDRLQTETDRLDVAGR